MLFNLFGKKEENSQKSFFKDRVYIGTEGKIKACVQLARENPDTIFIAWFSETAVTFKSFFKENDIDESRVIEAKSVHTSTIITHTPVFVEHFPLGTKEINLVENWGKQPIIVFSALDEPLFKHFGSDKLIPMIKMMGMKENEAIEHAMVSTSIVSAQQKIADKISIEQPANSQADWIKKNLQS